MTKNECDIILPPSTPLVALHETWLVVRVPGCSGHRRRVEYVMPTPFLTSWFVYTELSEVVVVMLVLVVVLFCCKDQDISGAGLPYAIQVATTLSPVSATTFTSSEVET